MDISIRSVGEACALSGKAFEPGDRVWSCLYRTAEGFVERTDVLEEELPNLELDDALLCKWSQVIKPREVTEAEEKRAALQSADDVFLSLFEEAESAEAAPVEVDAARGRLKFFLALQLERKRVLRPLGGRLFRHMPTKRVVTVPDLDITPELIADFQEEISLMGRG